MIGYWLDQGKMLIGDLGLFRGAVHSAGKDFYLSQVPHLTIISQMKGLFHGVQGIVIKISYSSRAFCICTNTYLSLDLEKFDGRINHNIKTCATLIGIFISSLWA